MYRDCASAPEALAATRIATMVRLHNVCIRTSSVRRKHLGISGAWNRGPTRRRSCRCHTSYYERLRLILLARVVLRSGHLGVPGVGRSVDGPVAAIDRPSWPTAGGDDSSESVQRRAPGAA